MTKEPDFLFEEVALVRVNLKVVVMEELKEFLKVRFMRFEILRAYDHVIDVGYCKIAGRQYFVNVPLKGLGSIAKSERHP